MRGLLTALLPEPTEMRASVGTSLARPSESAGWLEDLLGGGVSTAGRRVNANNALTVSALYAAVRLLASSVAQLPLPVIEVDGNTRTERRDHRLWRLLNDAPNAFMTAMEFRELVQAWAILHGNGIAYMELRGNMDIEEMIPLDPGSVKFWLTPDRQRMLYEYVTPSGRSVWLQRDQVFHLRAPLGTRWLGAGLIALAKDAIGLSMVAEEHAGRFYSNSAQPAGVLTTPKTLKKDAFNRIREQWNARHQGAENAFRTAILEEGLEWKPISLDLKDQQFLETRTFQVQEIARWVGVPPHLIGELTRSTNNNVESQGIEFVTFATGPWCVRWEQRIKLDCFGHGEQRKLYVRHRQDAFLRGQTLDRYRAYQIGRTGGWLSVNDIRGREEMNPIADGDIYLAPLNMVPADQFDDLSTKEGVDAAAGDEPGTQPGGTAPDLTRSAKVMLTAIAPLVHDAAARASRRAVGEMARAGVAAVPAADVQRHLEWCTRAIAPIAESFALGVAAAAGIPADESVRAIGQRAASFAAAPWTSALRSSAHAADVGVLAAAALDQIAQLVTAQLQAHTTLQEA